jgi:hypothetical protein
MLAVLLGATLRGRAIVFLPSKEIKALILRWEKSDERGCIGSLYQAFLETIYIQK